MNCCGIDRRSDVHEAQIERAPWQLDIAHVADERDVRVVHGNVEIDLIVEGGRALSSCGLDRFNSRVSSAREDDKTGADRCDSKNPRHEQLLLTDRAEALCHRWWHSLLRLSGALP